MVYRPGCSHSGNGRKMPLLPCKMLNQKIAVRMQPENRQSFKALIARELDLFPLRRGQLEYAGQGNGIRGKSG